MCKTRWRSVLERRFWCRDDVVDERRFFIQISMIAEESWLFQVSEFQDGSRPILLNEGSSASLAQVMELADMAVAVAASSNSARPRSGAFEARS